MGVFMVEQDGHDDEDAGEVIGLASALMAEDRNRRERVDLKQIGAELGVPAEYVERAESELRRKRAQRKVRLRIALAAALSLGLVGALWWNNGASKSGKCGAPKMRVDPAQTAGAQGGLEEMTMWEHVSRD
jgi:hypothetical protein